MTTTTGDRTPDPKHTFLGIAELMARYGLGKTSVCALVKREGFPKEVAPRKWRLDHVMAYEDHAGRASHRDAA